MQRQPRRLLGVTGFRIQTGLVSLRRSPEQHLANFDGSDTMDTNNVTLRNLTYTGGDDCIAIKPRSSNISIDGVTCNGGNGVAVGSLGQYLEDSTVSNVTFRDLKVG